MECEFPTINANNDEIKSIFTEIKTIAILGLSPDSTKDSYRVAQHLQNAGYTIIPVYPKEELILGEKVYRSLEEIPFAVDMVNIFRKPDALNAIVDSCMTRGDVKVFWAQIGVVNNEAAQRARDAGMKVVQNHCSMVEHRRIYG
jgi:hypothetical protein